MPQLIIKLCFIGPAPFPKSRPAASASEIYYFAFFIDSARLNPLARLAEMALDKVHPVP